MLERMQKGLWLKYREEVCEGGRGERGGRKEKKRKKEKRREEKE